MKFPENEYGKIQGEMEEVFLNYNNRGPKIPYIFFMQTNFLKFYKNWEGN